MANPCAAGPRRPRAPTRLVEILGGRDLDVARLAGDNMHGIAGALRQGGLVGGLDPGLPERHRRGQHVAAKTLGRLREKNGLAVQRLLHHGQSG